MTEVEKLNQEINVYKEKLVGIIEDVRADAENTIAWTTKTLAKLKGKDPVPEVHIEDVTQLPVKYFMADPVLVAIRKEVLKDHYAGQKIPGVQVITKEESNGTTPKKAKQDANQPE